MSRRVYVVAAEYSAHPRSPDLGEPAALADYRAYPVGDREDTRAEWERDFTRLFFRYPRTPDGWQALGGRETPVDLTDLLGSAGHRALCALHDRLGGRYRDTLAQISDLMITSMPGMAEIESVSPALIPQTLRAQLQLDFDCRCQFVVGTSDSGAWAFANAVRSARAEQKTVLVVAGQMIPSGYAAQRRIRSVLGRADQERGLDMLAIGDFLLDTLRRTRGADRDAVLEALADVRARKHQASQGYPATMQYGVAASDGPHITPYYHARDVAPACCGAAAVIVTSDEALVEALTAPSPRHRALVPVEVLGVGEGTSNPSVSYRKSPLCFAAPIVQALSAAAVDAEVPMRAFPAAAFAVLHDAFPSIELAFLLSVGLDWEAALDRMRTYWPNPYGGLLTFGHALGASGLVQICKVHHVLSGDRRYAIDPGGAAPAPLTFPDEGAMAFTTSVGGPLSHIVVSLFRGGATDWRTLAEPPRGPDLPRDHQSRRRHLRHCAGVYRARLAEALDAEGLGDLRFLEGVTQVDARSALHALSAEQLSAAPFPDLEPLLHAEHVEPARAELVTALAEHAAALRRGQADLGRGYDERLAGVVGVWRKAGRLRSPGLSDRDLTRRLKGALRLPIAVLWERTESGDPARTVAMRTSAAPTDHDFARLEGGVTSPAEIPATLLPWWHSRAERQAGPAPSGVEAACAEGRRLAEETSGELDLLRAYFGPGPDGPGAGGTGLRVIFYRSDVIGTRQSADPSAACEALATAVQMARGWLGTYAASVAQHGDSAEVLAFDERTPAVRVLGDAVRFARDVAEHCARQREPVLVRACLVVASDGRRFRDVTGRASVSSPAAARTTRLLDRIKERHRDDFDPARAWIAFDLTDLEDPGAALPAIARQLDGWQLVTPEPCVEPVPVGRDTLPTAYALWILNLDWGASGHPRPPSDAISRGQLG